jgi:hypothetical protein
MSGWGMGDFTHCNIKKTAGTAPALNVSRAQLIATSLMARHEYQILLPDSNMAMPMG